MESVKNYIDSINWDLQKVDNWAKANGLRIKRAFVVPDTTIKGNKIYFVESATNLGITFNGRLSWSNHINVIVGKVYDMLRNLWPVKDSTAFAIRIQLAKTYLIPVLLYGWEVFASVIPMIGVNSTWLTIT